MLGLTRIRPRKWAFQEKCPIFGSNPARVRVEDGRIGIMEATAACRLAENNQITRPKCAISFASSITAVAPSRLTLIGLHLPLALNRKFPNGVRERGPCNPHPRIKWRIEINKIDARVRKLASVAQPLQIVTEIQPIHWTTINQNSRLATKSLSLFSRFCKAASSSAK